MGVSLDEGTSDQDAGSMLAMLRPEIKQLVESYCEDSPLCDQMLRALGRPGLALHPEAQCRAGVLTLEVYQAITGLASSAAIRGAAGVELLMESSFIFDHVADEELDPEYFGSPAVELAVALALLTCGNAAACEATYLAGQGSFRPDALQRLFRSTTSACAGQLQDIYLEKSGVATKDQALQMTFLKAGSLGRLAAGFGASLATDNSETIALYEELGLNLFTYLQLMDDLRDACPEQARDGDLVNHKKTLPAVVFCESLVQLGPNSASDFAGPDLDSGEGIRGQFEASGVREFCTIVAEVFLNRTKAQLKTLRNSIPEVKGLEQFIESIAIRESNILAIP